MLADDGRRAIQSRKRLPKLASQHLKQERPPDGVESPRQVKLQKHAKGTKLMQKPRGLTHKDEVVVKTSPGDERILDVANKIVELGG